MDSGKLHPIWSPSSECAEVAQITSFRKRAAKHYGINLPNYASLHKWSTSKPEDFWGFVWRDFDIVCSQPPEAVMSGNGSILGTEWFPGALLNYAENLLNRDDASPAIHYIREDGHTEILSFSDLREKVAACAAGLRANGVKQGDRVVGILSNTPEAVIAMLATNSIGAIWSICAPDFGARAIIDRFQQITPKFLFCSTLYVYKGEIWDVSKRIAKIIESLPSVEQIVHIDTPGVAPISVLSFLHVPYSVFLQKHDDQPLVFAQLPFRHPSFILFTSGTTGKPKCIVHCAGGTLLQFIKENKLHYDIRAGESYLYYTNTSWNMWYWMVSALAIGATIVLYDGSPLWPHKDALFNIVDKIKLNHLGFSPAYIDIMRNAQLCPSSTHDLSSLRSLLSTGSPLTSINYAYIYENIADNIPLISLSGGTEVMAAFLTGNPAGPIFPGEMQVPALGMKVDVFDDEGHSLPLGTGELVCTGPFPSTPVSFWQDEGDRLYLATYFERYPGIWHHGDFIEHTSNGGFIISGRSDTTVNANGIRIGTAEIYKIVNEFDFIQDSLVIDHKTAWKDVIVLFVQLQDGYSLNDDMRESIAASVKNALSPRHVPKEYYQVSEIPRTKTGKIAETAVRKIFSGLAVIDVSTLTSETTLNDFKDIFLKIAEP